MIKENFGTRLQEARIASGLQRRDVAEKLNVSPSAVSQWESEKVCPDIGNLVRLSDLYGVSLDWLLKGEKEEEIVEEAGVSEEKETVTEITDNQREINNRTYQEILSILLLLVLSCHLAVLGMCVPVAIAIWMKKTERNYKWMYVVCIAACAVGIYNTCVVCDYLFDFGISTIEKISSL